MRFNASESARHEPMFFNAAEEPQVHEIANPAAETGFFLRREREHHGISIVDAAEATGIHPQHIDALEQGDLAGLPSREETIDMFAIYAEWLGFEAEPLLAHLETAMPAAGEAANLDDETASHVEGPLARLPRLTVPVIPEKVRSYKAHLTVASAALVLVLGIHFGLQAKDHAAPKTKQQVTVSAAPAAQTAPAPVTVAVEDQRLPEGEKIASANNADELGNFINDQMKTAPTPVKPSKTKNVANKIQDRNLSGDQIKTAAVSAIPTPSQGHVYGAENADAHVVLKALAPVWLGIEDAQGVTVMTQMLNTGDTYRVPNRDGLMALTKDGSRIAFSIDGKDGGVLGAPGKMLTGLKLDPASLATLK